MFASARKEVDSHIASLYRESSGCASINVPLKALPRCYSLQQLYDDLIMHGADNDLVSVIILESCLRNQERLVTEAHDAEYIQKLLSWVSKSIRPNGAIINQNDAPDDVPAGEKSPAIMHFRQMCAVALSAMECLQTHLNPPDKDVHPEVLLSLAACTDTADPWTSESTKELAMQLLHRHQQQYLSDTFMVEYVLKGFVLPLFSNSKPSTVTSQGRKALTPALNDRYRPNDLDIAGKPWKFREVSAVTVFGWTVRLADEARIYKNWHLFIPPLLTLLDDTSVPIRCRGLLILKDLLGNVPAKVLLQTGLSEVFEDAIMPTLLFLPTLTPIEESLQVLKPAYLALYALAEARFPKSEDQAAKMKFFDRIMRHGVLEGLSHARDHFEIVELLLDEMNTIICSMGLHAVKHLKDIIPFSSGVLSDPFGPAHLSLLLMALKVTKSSILNCWPRMTEPYHRMELVKALTLSWTTINKESSIAGRQNDSQISAVKKELKVAAMLLIKSVKGRIDVKAELEPLLQVDPCIHNLFSINATDSKTTV